MDPKKKEVGQGGGEVRAATIFYDRAALADFIEGSTLLATGGGGATQVAHNMLAMSGIEGVPTIAIDDVDDQAMSAMVAEVFAPSVIWDHQDYQSALHSFSEAVGRGVVFPGEAGAVNGIVPAIVAALSGSVLLTASTSDRSLPEMDMTLFQDQVGLGRVTIVGPTGSPVCSQDFGDDSNAIDAENFILSAMSDYQQIFQGVGGFAAYPISGAKLKETAASGLLFANTFEYALRLGQVMRREGTLEAVLATVDDYLGTAYRPYTLFTGYLVEAGLHPHAQDYGYMDFRSDDQSSALGLRIYSSNENMIAFATLWVLVQGAPVALELFPVAIGPDGIGYLLLEGESPKGYKAGYSFTNEAFDAQHGDPDFFRCHRLAVIGIPEPRLRRSDIIASFAREISRAMDSFGRKYEFTYVPIEKLPKIGPELRIVHGTGASEELRIELGERDGQGFGWSLAESDGATPEWDVTKTFRPQDIVERKLVYGCLKDDLLQEVLRVSWPQRG